MTPSILRNRLRTAAGLMLLLGTTTVLATAAPAEQISDHESAPGGVVVSDGGGAHFIGGYDSGMSCNDSYDSWDGSCSDCNECFNDGYKHYCPVWVGAEWIHWRLDGNHLPPLVTDGPATTSIAQVARLGDPDTRILSGSENVNHDFRDGFRVFGGVWLDCCRTCGVAVDYFDVGDDDYEFTSRNDPTRVVGRPFFNTELGTDDAQLVSVPGELDGTARVKSDDSFRGAGLTFNRRIWQCCDPCGCNSRELNALGGYRFYEYNTNLSITENLTVLPGTQSPLVPGTTFFVQDRFRTHNEFNGGEIGLQGLSKHNFWWIDGLAKLAIGQQHRTVTVNGQTFVVVPGGGSATDPGGLLTSELTNIGRYDDSDFVVIPEFRMGIGGQLTHYCSIRAGYNLIIWGDVARAASHLPPGLQVDPRNLPPVQAGGGADPAFPGIRGSELIAQGLDLSVMFAF
jgi:putative beta barrel porin BBP7